MFVKTLCLVGALAIGTGSILLAKQDQEPINNDKKPFMQRKLDASREIVKGLSIENFDLISKNAQDLMLLSHEAQWNAITTPEYLRMSSEFRGGAERLRDQAKGQNLDGCTLAYFEVTLSCVRCHKYLRKQKVQVK